MRLVSDGKFRVEGLRDLDRALGELPKRTGKAVLRRVLKKAAEPVAEKARQLAPVDTGVLRESIGVSARLKNKVGAAEFAAAMRAGLGKAAAVSALRDARRAAEGKGASVELYVGPAAKTGAIRYAHLVEFGSASQRPQPFMRPAWDSEKDGVLRSIKSTLGDEIEKTAKRLAKRAAKAKAKG